MRRASACAGSAASWHERRKATPRGVAVERRRVFIGPDGQLGHHPPHAHPSRSGHLLQMMQRPSLPRRARGGNSKARASAEREPLGRPEPLGPKAANDMARSAALRGAPYWLHSSRRPGCFLNPS